MMRIYVVQNEEGLLILSGILYTEYYRQNVPTVIVPIIYKNRIHLPLCIDLYRTWIFINERVIMQSQVSDY